MIKSPRRLTMNYLLLLLYQMAKTGSRDAVALCLHARYRSKGLISYGISWGCKALNLPPPRRCAITSSEAMCWGKRNTVNPSRSYSFSIATSLSRIPIISTPQTKSPSGHGVLKNRVEAGSGMFRTSWANQVAPPKQSGRFLQG